VQGQADQAFILEQRIAQLFGGLRAQDGVFEGELRQAGAGSNGRKQGLAARRG